ncbi:MAG: hypothetical protein ACFB0D_09445 [Phormidesmis sp.]
MTYNSSTHAGGMSQTTGLDRAIAGVLVAGVTFVLGYTGVRASLAASAPQTSVAADSDVTVVIPHEGALWSDVSTSF